jgi:hypothetical protein
LELPDNKPHSRLRAWFAPDLGLSASFVTAFCCLFLFDGGRNLFRDSDTGWHIRTGELILDTATLPKRDPYSWSRPGQQWFAWEWGVDVLMAGAHRKAGLPGVAALYVSAIAGVTWLWFRLQWRLETDFLLACVATSPMLSTANLHWLARPHIFGWVLLLCWMLWLERSDRSPGIASAIGALAAGCLWANLHASFFLGAIFAFIYAVFSPRCLLSALFFSAGTFVNPYGPALHMHLAYYLSNTELLKRVGEFQSFNFQAEGSAQIILTVLLAASGVTLATVQRRPAHALILLVMLIVALRSARGLPILALMLPFALSAITRALCQGRAPSVARALQYSANLRRIDSGLRGYAWMPVLLVLIWAAANLPAMRRSTGFPDDQFPVAESLAVERLPESSRLLAPDKFGGYLIYRFGGNRKVFFDGRSDYYGVDFIKQYIDLVQVRPGWERLISKWHPTYALLPPDSSLLAALERDGWSRLHTGKAAVLLEKPRL